MRDREISRRESMCTGKYTYENRRVSLDDLNTRLERARALEGEHVTEM